MILSVLTILFLFTVVCCEEMTLNEIGEFITNGMDKKVDPCNNFYNHVCGNWENYWTNKLVWNVMEMSKQYLIQKMKDVLESSDINEDNVKLIMEKKYYEACMDTNYSLVEGSNFYVNLVTKSDRFNLNWKRLVEYYAEKIGETFLFHIMLDESKEFSIVRPYMSKTNHVPYEMLDFQDIDLFFKIRFGIQHGSNNKFREPLLRFIQDINEIVNEGESSERYLISGDVLKVQKIYESRCSSLSPKSEINWLKFLQILAGRNGKFVRPSFKIKIDEDYLSQLCEIISRTSDEIIYIYLHYNFEFDDKVLFYTNIKNTMTSFKRSEKCLNDLPLTSGVNNEIMNSEEFQERKSTVMRIFNYLKPLLREEILNSWLEDGAKEVEVKEVEKIILKITDIIEIDFHFMLETKLMSYDFEITPIGLQNFINFKKAEIVNIFEFSLEKQDGESGNSRRTKRGIYLNAVFTGTENKVLLTPALLFTPFFNKDAPMAYNIANLGVLLGHEMSHSVDISSLTFMYESSWIENNSYTAKIFDEKKSCLVNQFNNLKEDGTFTLNENFADVLGLKLAFEAMRRVIDDDPSLGDLTLPGFEEWNAKQLFFITYANQFCEKNVDYFLSIHSSDEARVIGPLQNSKAFAEAFNCKEGQHMNPVDKCDFWEAPIP
ncbi:membrane metallo-endopeptidase-like 1 isoform X2 [Leptopilina heterotoma]|uniref:membrane metallo-endopeptidase-like 1 isoform X2 n=1 Tax=Leptopilina heterotoma TaxID=63436 RepID=UPI001CA9C6FC|nr:membrane metallo-endopeptidase-like 1 isoform X2 [Leptopilina heterotoma]